MKLVKPDLYLHLGWFDLPAVEEISIAKAPASMQGLRMLFVSDIHLRRQVPDDKLEALISLLAAQKADMILLGGDYGEQAEQTERFFRAFARLQPPLGSFAVLGNNDREFFPETDVLKALMQSCGVRLLVNESVQLNGDVEIGGCDEYKHGSPQTEKIFHSSAYRILLSHFPVKPECRCDLMLSGHTHGGQFNVLGITPYIIGFEHGYKIEAISGMTRLDDTALLTSKGIGMSKLPLRIGVRPQVHLVKFTG